jgi:hypothetical protein
MRFGWPQAAGSRRVAGSNQEARVRESGITWRIKPIVQTLISFLHEPYAGQVNQVLSRRFGGLSKGIGPRPFEQILRMVRTMEGCGVTIDGLRALEIGTGWSFLSV